MGLCKCPKRKVTNLFCFEHKVNVCENCLVTDHVRCIIKSYLQWLQDSDFETACCICQDTLEAGDVVRLLCYDVLHVSCAEKFLLAYPANTAPDGFFCPACHGPFFPPDMVASPVADQLRRTLEGMKDLQKRLNGLSVTPHDNSGSKCSPPTHRRPEPEGKEERSDTVVEPVLNDNVVDPVSPEVSALPLEKDVPSSNTASVEDDPESDSMSSASDFIATHSGSLPRDTDEAPLSALSPARLSNASEDVEEENTPLILANKLDSAVAEKSAFIPLEHVANEALAASSSFSLPTVYGQSMSSSSFSLNKSNQDVVVDVVEDAAPSISKSSTVHSVSIAMNDSHSVEDRTNDRVQIDAGAPWTLGSSSLASSITPSKASMAHSTQTTSAYQANVRSTLQRHASVPDATPEYSTPKLPFADPHLQHGPSPRTTSSSMMAPRVAQSYGSSLPRSDDHDDHKYRRKPIMEVIRTWLKIFSPPRGRRSSTSLWRRFVIILLIAVLSLIGLVLLFHHMGRSGRDDDDPLLDLKANPFVKVDDS